MNKAFREVWKQSLAPPVVELTHQQRVTRLYRHTLKLTFSWAVNRQIFLEEAQKIRKLFRQRKGLSEAQGKYYLIKGEQDLANNWHPDRYIMPWMPGGSKFMRNPTPPDEAVYFGGKPDHPTPQMTIESIPIKEAATSSHGHH